MNTIVNFCQWLPKKKVGEWHYKAEPYVYSSNIFGPESDEFGLANVSWLSGTAARMYISVTQCILGIKPTWNGLTIKPCLPSKWKNLKVKHEFRGEIHNIDYPSTFTNDSKKVKEDAVKVD